MIISGINAIDDLPSAIQEYADELGEIIIIDAHNAYKQAYNITVDDIEEIKTLIATAAHMNSKSCSPYHLFIKNKISSTNICGYLAMLVLDYGKVKYAIFMIDSNNIEKKFRDKIKHFLETKGLKSVIVSTDNHLKTGMPPKLEYEPAGADESDVMAVFDFLKKINFDNINEKGEIRYNKKTVSAKIIGKNFFDSLEKAILLVGKKAIYLFFFIILVQLLAAISIGILLM